MSYDFIEALEKFVGASGQISALLTQAQQEEMPDADQLKSYFDNIRVWSKACVEHKDRFPDEVLLLTSGELENLCAQLVNMVVNAGNGMMPLDHCLSALGELVDMPCAILTRIVVPFPEALIRAVDPIYTFWHPRSVLKGGVGDLFQSVRERFRERLNLILRETNKLIPMSRFLDERRQQRCKKLLFAIAQAAEERCHAASAPLDERRESLHAAAQELERLLPEVELRLLTEQLKQGLEDSAKEGRESIAQTKGVKDYGEEYAALAKNRKCMNYWWLLATFVLTLVTLGPVSK